MTFISHTHQPNTSIPSPHSNPQPQTHGITTQSKRSCPLQLYPTQYMQCGFQSTNTTTQLKHQHQHHPQHITEDLRTGGFKDHIIIDQTSST